MELPVISSEHIRVARLIKCMFTGDLNRQISSYPVFPGLEKHLVFELKIFWFKLANS